MAQSKRNYRLAALVSLLVLMLGALTWGVFYVNSLLPIATGYSAKQLCSAVFISHRSQQEVEAVELSFFPVSYVSNTVNYDDSTVTSRLLWKTSKAVFRRGVGSTLLEGPLQPVGFSNTAARAKDSLPWPLGNRLPDSLKNIPTTKLQAVAQQLIDERSYGGRCFAFLVMQNGLPVYEKYANGFSSQTKFLGWSMAKSFTNALVGAMVQQMGVDIYQPTGFAEWQGDGRKGITPNDLLRMQSGLEWNEDYGNRSDVTQMLYCHPSASIYALKKPLAYPVGGHWYYSSGSTNLVVRWARSQFSTDSAFYAFMYQHLLRPIGMGDAFAEPDASGLFVGSSYIYATARDYARFALLYLQNGVFSGEQILPLGWVKYTTTPTRGSSSTYGASFWLNANGDLPADMYSCQGHDGQRIFIVPSHNLAVVVLGHSPKSKGTLNFDRLMADVLKSVK